MLFAVVVLGLVIALPYWLAYLALKQLGFPGPELILHLIATVISIIVTVHVFEIELRTKGWNDVHISVKRRKLQ